MPSTRIGVDIRGRLGDVDLWEIENRGDMNHPFHLHTYPLQIVSRNGVPEALRAWKDIQREMLSDLRQSSQLESVGDERADFGSCGRPVIPIGYRYLLFRERNTQSS